MKRLCYDIDNMEERPKPGLGYNSYKAEHPELVEPELMQEWSEQLDVARLAIKEWCKTNESEISKD